MMLYHLDLLSSPTCSDFLGRTRRSEIMESDGPAREGCRAKLHWTKYYLNSVSLSHW